MILISEKSSLRIIKTVFVTKDSKELEKEQLTNAQYQDFCNEFELSRLKNKIIWPEMDARYNNKK